MNSNRVLVGDFNTSLATMDRSARQKIKKEIVALSDTLDQMDLIDIFKDISPQSSKIHIFFKCTWNIFKDRTHITPQNEFQ